MKLKKKLKANVITGFRKSDSKPQDLNDKNTSCPENRVL